MIVKMKKLSVFFLAESAEKVETVSEQLRSLGALHINARVSESQYRKDMDKAVNTLSSLKKQPQESGSKDAAYYVRKTIELSNEKSSIVEKLKTLEKTSGWYDGWGEFSLETVKQLREASVFVNLYEVPAEEVEAELLKKHTVFVVGKTKKTIRLLHISYSENEKLEGLKREIFPETDVSKISSLVADHNNRLKEIDEKLLHLAGRIQVVKEAIVEEDKKLEFDAVCKKGIRQTPLDAVNTLEAFIPVHDLAAFEKFAAEKGWGYTHRDPVLEDQPPTLLKASKIIRPVQALYDIIGLNIGYFETDVSVVFYMFFIVFTGLLIGDAGYGSLFLIGTLVAHIKSKNPDSKLLTLGYVLSMATITWGALIGNWFGSETIAGIPFIQQMTIPELASFDLTEGGLRDSTNIMMRISFYIAITHLSIAHLIAFWQRKKSLDAIGQLAWVSFLWGIFFLLQNLIFQEILHPYFMHQMIGSMVLILLFSDTQDGFVNGLKSTALTAPFDFIGGLSDVASYLRLFAVGTAALMLASVFNNLAEGAGVFAPLLLLVGHVFNIVLALFGVFVHATRLETVEFSNHAQLEWAGNKYRPFKA